MRRLKDVDKHLLPVVVSDSNAYRLVKIEPETVWNQGVVTFKEESEVRFSQPKYDPTAWRDHSDFALKKLNVIDDAIEEDKCLYKEQFETILMSHMRGEKFLDVGCAGGHYYQMLKSQIPDIDYTGVDVTPEYIEIARERFPGVPFVLGDIRNLPFEDKSYDTVFCFFVLLHLDKESVSKAIRELCRVARRQVLLAGYFSRERIYGFQKTGNTEFIYDVVGLDELAVPGWTVYAHKSEETKTVRVPVINEKGDEEIVFCEVKSFLRLIPT